MRKDELLDHVNCIRAYINKIGEIKYNASSYILRLHLENQLNSLASTLIGISIADESMDEKE